MQDKEIQDKEMQNKEMRKKEMQTPKKKRLLITASTFPRWAGDTEPRFILDLAKSLNSHYDVTVLVPADPSAKDKETIEGVKVERYHYFPVHKWETLCYPGAIVPRIREKKIRILLVPFLFLGLYHALYGRRKQYDVVHANWLIPQGIVQSFLHMPYLLTGHGADIASLNFGPIRLLKIRAIRKAGAVTTVSQALKNKATGLFPEWEQKKISKKISVQSFGCETSKFGAKHRVDNFWRQGRRKVVLFVGRLAEKKGVSYLIEAMQYTDAVLVIVGDGPLRKSLREQVKALGLTQKVIFMGARSHDELPTIYASTDVFAVPSVTAGDGDVEGLPMVLLEAMASGLPVAASRTGGITDLICDGQNGLLSEERNARELADNINRLLTDEALRAKLLANAAETVRRYDYRTVGENYAKLIGICDHSGISH